MKLTKRSIHSGVVMVFISVLVWQALSMVYIVGGFLAITGLLLLLAYIVWRKL